MELNEYQSAAMATCTPTASNFSYMMLNLAGEVGEIASKVAKGIRKDELDISDNKLYSKIENHDNFKQEILLELGDVLWQVAGLASSFNATLEDIAKMNLAKLADRQQRGVIIGNGDYR